MEKRYDIIKINQKIIFDLFSKKFNSELGYSLEKIPIKNINPTSKYVQEERLRYAYDVAHKLEEKGLQLYEPHIKRNGEVCRVVPPPIVEERECGYVLCDGTHRITIAKELNKREVLVLVVKGASLPMAGDITSWESIIRTNNKYKSCENFINYCEVGMTGYSKFCNSLAMEVEVK